MDIKKLTEALFESGYDNDYVELCRQYAERLINNGLPVIFDTKHLCLLAGYEEIYLEFLLNQNDLLYKKIKIPKRSGGIREISIPAEGLKFLQRWILNNILERISLPSSAIGFRKGFSIVDNATVHINKPCIINIDMKDFFPSISFLQVYKVFRYFGYTTEVSKVLSKLCTYKGVLPQGAPSSPYLSNIICRRLDKRLFFLSKKIEATYSRYADDITFSGDRSIVHYIQEIKKIINDEGFKINENKTRIKYSNERQIVTGLIVNKKLGIPHEIKDMISKHIYFCKKYGVNGHTKYIGLNYSHFKEYLYGLAYFIKMVELEKGLKFLRELDEIVWDY